MFLPWYSAYNTGIEEFDAQHKHLVDIINELYAIRHAESLQETVDGILSKLIDCLKHHFDSEENHLERLNYPELEKHKAEHQKLRKTIEMIQGFHSSGRWHLAADMFLELMKHWLIDHILNDDKEALTFNG